MQLFFAVASPHAQGAAQAHSFGQSLAVEHGVVPGWTHLPPAQVKPVGPQSVGVTHGS